MRPRAVPLLALLMLAAPVAARAQAVQPYGIADVGHAGRYGYADPLVRDTYIGAPLARFPRPSEIVPAPWSYGTYGVPTVTGIPASPVAQPTLTVISGGPIRSGGASTRDRRMAAVAGSPPGPRIIQVQVPRR